MRACLVLILVGLAGVLVGGAWGMLDNRSATDPTGKSIERLLSQDSQTAEIHPDDAARATVHVDQEVYDFGSMENHKTGEHEFVFKNAGRSVLTLKEGGTTCRCAVSKLAKGTLSPGESTKVKMTWTAKEFFGPFEQTARIETNDPDRSVVTLKVKGRITAAVRAVPGELVFSRLSVGQSVQAEARLFAYTSDSFQTAGFELLEKETAPYFEVHVSPLGQEVVAAEQDAKSGQLVKVTVKSGLPQGPFEQTIRLKTNVAAAPTIDLPVKGRVGSDISLLGRDWNAAADRLDIGMVKSAEGATRQLTLVVRGPFRRHVALEVAEVFPPGLVEVELGKPTEINQGVALQTPMVVRIRKGSPAANYLGPQQGQVGYVRLRTTHPHVPELKFLVRFAVEGE